LNYILDTSACSVDRTFGPAPAHSCYGRAPLACGQLLSSLSRRCEVRFYVINHTIFDSGSNMHRDSESPLGEVIPRGTLPSLLESVQIRNQCRYSDVVVIGETFQQYTDLRPYPAPPLVIRRFLFLKMVVCPMMKYTHLHPLRELLPARALCHRTERHSQLPIGRQWPGTLVSGHWNPVRHTDCCLNRDRITTPLVQ
jgi:hypothetical protein